MYDRTVSVTAEQMRARVIEARRDDLLVKALLAHNTPAQRHKEQIKARHSDQAAPGVHGDPG